MKKCQPTCLYCVLQLLSGISSGIADKWCRWQTERSCCVLVGKHGVLTTTCCECCSTAWWSHVYTYLLWFLITQCTYSSSLLLLAGWVVLQCLFLYYCSTFLCCIDLYFYQCKCYSFIKCITHVHCDIWSYLFLLDNNFQLFLNGLKSSWQFNFFLQFCQVAVARWCTLRLQWMLPFNVSWTQLAHSSAKRTSVTGIDYDCDCDY